MNNVKGGEGMKRRMRRFTVMLLACSLLFQLFFSNNAFAAENDGTETEIAARVEGTDNLNTTVERSLTETDMENISAAAAYIREEMTQRETVITGIFEISDMENMNSVFETLSDQIFICTSESDEGDYLKQHSGGISWNYEASFDGNVTTFSYELQTSYYTTLKQEKEVADRIDEVLADLSLDGLSDYEKAKKIYDYIAINVSYDYEHLSDSSYMLSHTAYAALIQETAVCQGYASLFYRMAHEAGLSVRIVTGLVDGEAHAWNMVKIGDLYYYVDTTHASSSGNRDDYFLKGSISFADRQLDSDFLSVDFTSEFPMSDFDYSEDSGNLEVSSGELTPSIQWSVKSSTDEVGKAIYYLELQGNGEISDYAQNDELPWEEWRDQITVVTVESGITKIGSYVFSNMDALTTVRIANTVTALGDGAFYNCGKLTNLQIPDSVASFGDSVIGGTYGKTQWEYNLVEKKLIVTGDGAMGEPYVEGSTTEKNASRVPWNRYKDQIEEVVIEEGVVNLSTYAFNGMTSLIAVTLPSTLEEIGEGSFESCTALTYICIPDSVKTIGHYAFRYCEGLRSIHIPASVASIGVRAFADCPYLHEFYFYGDAPKFENQAIMDSEYITVYYDGSGWNDVKSLFEYLTFETWEPGEYDDSGTNVSGEGIKSQTSGKYGDDIEWNYDEESAVLTLSGKGEMADPITIVTVDETTNITTTSYSTNAVPWNPFSQQIKEVMISDGITSISRYAFWWLTQIENISIPDSVITIGQQSFVHCSKLQTVTLGEDLTTIGKEAFKDCTALKEIYISDKLTSVEESAFTGCETLTDVYYEGSENEWEDIVIGEDNVPLINAEIHYNYGEEEPWVPDGTFSIAKSGTWVVGKECALSGSYSASTPGNAEAEAEEIVWSSSDSSILDVSDTIIDFTIADAENNHVSIQKSFTAKKAGTVTITATAPDGRSESITVNVEPELIAVGTDEKFTEETGITLCQMTLEESDKDFLESIMSKVNVEVASNSNNVFEIIDGYYEIAEDGLSAQFVYVLSPVSSGSTTFQISTSGGQKIEVIVRSGLQNESDGFFVIPDDEWKFKNYGVDSIPLTEEDYNALMYACGDNDASKEAWNSEINPELPWYKYLWEKISKGHIINGQCYGMALSALLVKNNLLSLDSIQDNISSLYEAEKNENSMSVIGWYQLAQCLVRDNIIKNFEQSPTEKQLNTIANFDNCFLLAFGAKNWGEHAVVGYAIEKGNWEYHGRTYDTRVLTYDSNTVYNNSNIEEYYLYFNYGTDDWEIPHYYSGGVSSEKTGYLVLAYENVEDLNMDIEKWREEFRENRITLTTSNSIINLDTEKESFMLSGGKYSGEDYYAYYEIGYNEASDNYSPKTIVEFDDISSFTISSGENDILDYSLLFGDFYLQALSENFETVYFSDTGEISITGLENEVGIALTANDNVLPWDTVSILNDDASRLSMEQTNDGILVESDNLNDVIVYATNDGENKELSFSSNEESVLITESDNELIVLIDTNNDGVYDTDVNEKEENIHEYGAPKFIWSEDYEACTAVFTCESCDDEQKAECNISSETTNPTCTEAGNIVYTATATFAGKEYTDTQEVIITATGHTYEYTDNGDGTHTKSCISGDNTTTESHTYQNGACTYCGAEEPKGQEATENKPSQNNRPSQGNTPTAARIPVMGTIFIDRVSGGKYQVTKAGVENKGTVIGAEVAYVEPTTNAKQIIIPEYVSVDSVQYKVTAVLDNAFRSNKTVTKVKVGNNVISIGTNAFSGCKKLKSVVIGKNVATIGSNAFKKCTAIKKVIIPDKVNSIGKNSFTGCKKLKKVIIKTKILKKIGKNAFKGINKASKIKVPQKQLKKYQKLFKKAKLAKNIKIIK